MEQIQEQQQETRTKQKVNVYWIDYQGRRVKYNVLGYNDRLDINTFVTHPWIFVEQETEDRYLANGKEIYFPEAWTACYVGVGRMQDIIGRISRTQVYITQPMYTLRDMCLRYIKRRLRYDRQSYLLEIPWILKQELYFMAPRKPGNEEEEESALNLRA